MHQHRRNRILMGQDNNALTWLIIINAVIFVLLNFIKIIYYLSFDSSQLVATQNFHLQILDWFTLPASLGKLATRPWTILSYMFSQESVWQLIGTLLWLWAFGYIFQDLTGNSKLIPLYLYGGFAGAVFFVASANLLPALSSNLAETALIGGGASVMAVAVGTTTLSPGYRIFPMLSGGIPLWVLTLIFVAVDYATIGSANGSFAIAHLAGAAIGFIFIKQMQRGKDWSIWMVNAYQWTDDLFNPEKKIERKTHKMQTFYKATRKPFEKKPKLTQEKLDELLDKINDKGYHSLSDDEKDLLKKASKEDF